MCSLLSPSLTFRRLNRSYGNATRTITNDLDDWNDPDRLDRVEFYMVDDSEDDHVNFEAIIWKRSQTIKTIGTIKGYPRNHHFYSKSRINLAWATLKSKTKIIIIQKCSHHVCWALFEISLSQYSNIKFSKWYYSRGTLLAARRRKMERKSR